MTSTAAGIRPLPRRARLLIVWLLLCHLSGCGGAGSPEHRQAIIKLQGMGAKVNVKRGGYEVDFTGTYIEDADLKILSKIENIKVVLLTGTRISDEGLAHLRPLATLTNVALSRTMVTPAGAESLQKALPEANIKYP